MLNSMSVKSRLTIMAFLPAAFFIALSIVVIAILHAQNKGIDSLYMDRVVPLKQIKYVSDNYAVSIVDLLQKYRADMLTKSAVLAQIEQAEKNANEEWQAYLSTALTDNEKSLVDTTKQYLRPVEQLVKKYKNMISDGSMLSYSNQQFNTELYGAFDLLSSSYNALIELQLDESKKFVELSHDKLATTETTLIVSAILLLGIMLVVAWLIYYSISRPLRHLQKIIVDVAETTNLTLRVDVQGQDEFATTARAFNSMLQTIHGLVREVTNVTLSLSSAAEEMNIISNQVANTATEQEHQNTMIATAITQMSSAIQEVANSALVTSQRANEADGQAVSGQEKVKQNILSINALSQVVNDSTDIIQQLHNQANEINQVVQLIKSVAEQTNLLALNAAIEAARAGESGRGFAVVADEVRQLAHNTQKATGTINELIGKLQIAAQKSVESMSKAKERAGESVNFAQESSAVLDDIIKAMSQISDMNTQVATATEEQTMVANEISENVNKFSISIASVTESAKQNAIASRELTELAVNLQSQIRIFRV